MTIIVKEDLKRCNELKCEIYDRTFCSQRSVSWVYYIQAMYDPPLSMVNA